MEKQAMGVSAECAETTPCSAVNQIPRLDPVNLQVTGQFAPTVYKLAKCMH